jgi:monoamine oxidase
MLVALPSGGMAAAVETMTDAEVVASALAALRGVYGAAVPARPSAFLVTRWGMNPYARGTHSYYAVGSSPADRATLLEPVGGSLLFAGEAASVLHPSTLHGAYQSGEGQAERILAAMEFPQEGDDTCSAECYAMRDVEVPST